MLVCLIAVAIGGCFDVWKDLGINREMLFSFWSSLITLFLCATGTMIDNTF